LAIGIAHREELQEQQGVGDPHEPQGVVDHEVALQKRQEVPMPQQEVARLQQEEVAMPQQEELVLPAPRFLPNLTSGL
jgi:hypothetical protein